MVLGFGSDTTNQTGLMINNGVRGSLFWRRFYTYYSVQIKARYAFLKSEKILHSKNFQNIVESQAKKITSDMMKAENTRWGYPFDQKKSAQQIQVFLKNRLAYLDTQFL